MNNRDNITYILKEGLNGNFQNISLLTPSNELLDIIAEIIAFDILRKIKEIKEVK
jgi:hypothetical protein